MQKEKLEMLASERSTPCVTLSFNTHRTHPDSLLDTIALKNLCKKAKERLEKDFELKDIANLLEKLESLPSHVNVNYNLDSMHIFLSNTTFEIIKSPRSVKTDEVYVSGSFAIKTLIKDLNNMEDYYILLLSQSGVRLYQAINDAITDEIFNDDFPFDQSDYFDTTKQALNDPKRVDDLVREYLNNVDKAFINIHNQSGFNCVVICTEDNFSRLLQVSDKVSAYYGYASINYNDTSRNTIAAAAWNLIKGIQAKRKINAINEIQEAVGLGKVITDLGEIYKAAKEGRGELFIAHSDFNQAVKIAGQSFELVNDDSQPDVIDDITSDIAWEVISKKGRALFTSNDEIKSLGRIALKVRY